MLFGIHSSITRAKNAYLTVLVQEDVAIFIDQPNSLYAFLSDCPQFTRLGCFRDSLNPRPLPTILMTDRDPSMRVFSGVNIDWADWNDYKTDLACRCAKKTKKSGFKVFGLQFYGK